MKKTLITLAALAAASVAQAVTYSQTDNHVALENITSATGFFADISGNNGGMTIDTTQSNPVKSYTFTFTFLGPVTTDTVVAAYWNQNSTADGAHAFVVDSATQTLTIGMGDLSTNLGAAGTKTYNVWSWTGYGEDDRVVTFSNANGFYALEAGTTYTVSLTDNTGGAQVATLSWKAGSATANYRGYMEDAYSYTNGGRWITGAANTEIGITPTTPPTPAVPEPATATLSLLALAGLAARRRRK